jgi:hypothetical protein
MIGVPKMTLWKRLERGEVPAQRFGNVLAIRREDAALYKEALDTLTRLRERAQEEREREAVAP